MSKGWIRLHRDIFDNFLYTERPFCRVAAFIDLVLLANHEDNEIFFDGEIMVVKRGQVVTSVRKLCDRWGWSNTKINKYFKILESKLMLSRNSDKKKTLITLINYRKYQDTNITETSLKHHSNITETSLKHTNKNVNNDNNDNNDIYKGYDLIFSHCLKRNIQQVVTREIAIKQFMNMLTVDEMLDCINRSEGKHIEYLLKVFQTKSDLKNEPKPQPVQKPQQQRKNIQKPVLKPDTVKPDTVDDDELERMKKIALLLDGGLK
jgi:DNA replication protein DnaD